MSLSVVPTQPQSIQEKIQRQAAVPLGQLLVQAGLVSEDQVQLALQNQSIPGYEDFKIGEILALRGWIKQDTCDFFATRWASITANLSVKDKHRKLGYYLLEAGILTEAQVNGILRIQQRSRELFGQIAVAQGYLKPQTVDFFVQNLSLSKRQESPQNDSLVRAERYFKLRDLQGAMLELREVLRGDGNNGIAHAWLTRIYLEQGQNSLAKVHLKQAIALSPNHKFVKETKKQFFASLSPSKTGKQNKQPAKSAQRGSWMRFG